MTQPNLQILSLGSSCINRFQFEFFQERQPKKAPAFHKGLFDWNICSLKTTLDILTLADNGTLTATLADPASYALSYDAILSNKHMQGFFFFHETDPHLILSDPARRDAFLAKVAHLSKPFTAPHRGLRTHLFWSNIQPNLPNTVTGLMDGNVAGVEITWDDFRLTSARYAKIHRLGRRLFGVDTTFSFVSAPQDVDPQLLAQPDVKCLDVPRGPDFKGAPDLYDPVLMQILAGYANP